jgi:2-C-methyl-D-erythritol 4-phosphate cytidylyltransferase/2-C-methyl-D-erythritol 2,4-cyclodiphosphate synthase
MIANLLAIIPAAGIGERFDSSFPKQYSILDGKSVIELSVEPFLNSNLISKIIIPISSNDEYIKKQKFYGDSRVIFVEGGNSRSKSVLNALNHKEAAGFNFVITHDAARPRINEQDISDIYNEIINSNADCSIFSIPVVDSIKRVGEIGDITEDKANFYLVQTPQISKYAELKLSIQALTDKNITAPDESFAMESQNYKISRIDGRSSNIKITHKEDLDLLRRFITRTGTGFDLHTYKAGKGILIGSCMIECDYAIEAHSDGDVLLHSIADSILGASALGDIGIFFSDKDQANKGMDSKEIIKFCLTKIKGLGLEIYNVDATIICESPKISPHRDKILDALSDILEIPISRIGLKATTSEKIGIIGRNQAIAVQSSVNLKGIL